MMFSLRHATFAQWIISLRVMANSFTVHSFPGSKSSLQVSFFCHATLAWRDTFLQAAADFLLDPLFPWVLSFIFWWRTAARFRTLRCFLGSPTGITVASPLGIS
jgi:hypothetical protein